MRSKLTLIVAVVTVAAMLVGGVTMALFTDTANNPNNTFSAGTVDIRADRDLGDPLPGPMFYTTLPEGQGFPSQTAALNPTGLWQPGMAVIRLLDVRNMGSLQVRLHQVSAEITSINGQPPMALPLLATSFANNMNVLIHVNGFPGMVLYNGPLAGLLAGPVACVFSPVISPWVPPGFPPVMHLPTW